MLHGGRLGDVRKDVAEFTSSRKDDACLAEAVLAINKAHVVMLMNQKIISLEDGVKILSALTKIDSKKIDPNTEDIHMAIEEEVLEQTGAEVGGNMHVAKSRNDQVTTAIRMVLRKEILTIIQGILNMQRSLLDTADKHTKTIILEYTHLQAAQPVTFAHYLLSFVDALGRDFDRLMSAYNHVNQCPLGACGLATTSFPINREETAKLLGFEDVLENSIDAVGSRDFIIESQAALVLLAINLSRLAEDLIIWSSAEFGTVELPDEFTSTSSIMPQKKNPEVLEIIRARASHVLGDFVASTAAVKSLPTTYNLDFQEITPKLWSSVINLSGSLKMFASLISKITVSFDVENKAAAGFVGATEVANMLVHKHNVAFRTSHRIVGALVKVLVDSKKTLLDVSPELIQKVALETTNIKIIVDKQDLFECTNPRKIVETYKVHGGPSPKEVNRFLRVRHKVHAKAQSKLEELEKNLANAKDMLSYAVEECLRLKNDKLKNLK